MCTSLKTAVFLIFLLGLEYVLAHESVLSQTEINLPDDDEPTIIEPNSESVNGSNDEDRIIQGVEVPDNYLPFVVSLQIFPNESTVRSFCTGSILDTKLVVTASHCFNNAKFTPVYVIAGTTYSMGYSPPAQIVEVEQVIRHPKHDKVTKLNDIALLILAEPLNWTDSVQPISYVGPDYNAEENQRGMIAGWGAFDADHTDIDSNYLLYATVNIVQQTICAKFYKITANQFCAGNFKTKQGACRGDSGGPFLQTVDKVPQLVGITSYGNKNCGIFPSVFTRVGKYYKWIKSHHLGQDVDEEGLKNDV